ncbi:MAG: hypothetical protein Q9213_007156 [Squamulea squamosa]
MLTLLASLTAIPLLAQAALREFVVYPRDRLNTTACRNTNRTLFSKGFERVQSYSSPRRGVTEFWLVEADSDPTAVTEGVPDVGACLMNLGLTENCGVTCGKDSSIEDEVEASSGVSTATTDTTTTSIPAPTRTPTPRRNVMQRAAPQDLDLVSWPPGRFLPWKMKGYVYDVVSGDDTYIYVIGDGINFEHRDFVRSRSQGWYFGPNARHIFRDESAPAGFSSCAASKAAGWYNGVSKNSKIVVIKGSMSLANNTWAFAKVLEDVILKRRQGKSVILYPRRSKHQLDAPSKRGWERIRIIMQDLFAADVVIVSCAGDDAQRIPRRERNILDGFPAAWSSKTFPLIVAGAATGSGEFARFSRGVDVSQEVAWAPGDGVACASNVASRDQTGQGTAFAAGMVAGLAAYLLRNSTWILRPGLAAADMRIYLSHEASRPITPKVKPNIIWNLQDGSRDPNPRFQQTISLTYPADNSSGPLVNNE